MNKFKLGNQSLLSGQYLDAINSYYYCVNQQPDILPVVCFNLICAIDKFFGTSFLKDYEYYREQYLYSSQNVSSDFDTVICVHNALHDVKKCIASVIASSFGNLSIILVDDGSEAATADFIKELSSLKFLKVTRNESALGYTLAANIGIKLSGRNFVTLLNSDTIVSPYWQHSINNVFKSDVSVGVVGPLSNTASWQSVPDIFDEEGDWAENPLPNEVTAAYFANLVRMESKKFYPKIGFVNGFCFTIKRDVLNNVGLFDEVTFGRGYGEENDYSIRARIAGWSLAIADDCYVYHSQSKSYSHERRAILSKHAGEMLNAKHGSEPIVSGVRTCHHHLQMQYNRKFLKNAIGLDTTRRNVENKYISRRVGFILPAGGVGGGSNIVILEALTLHSLGIKVSIINLESNRVGFSKFYPDLPFDVIYLSSPVEIANICINYDALVATLYRTVYWFDFLPFQHGIKLGYYIQDYEPAFFAAGSDEHTVALQSYNHNSDVKLFTKTHWNENMVNSNHGVNVHKVGLSFDVNNFYPSSRFSVESTVNIIAMIRFETPRRGPYITIDALKRLYDKYQNSINISVFGSDVNHPEFSAMNDVKFSNLGVLDANQTASLFRSSDIFIDCSHFQAMGLSALECMASGVAVVGTVYGGMSEFIINEKNGYLVDVFNVNNIIDAVSRLIENPDIRWEFQENALEVVNNNPIFTSAEILKILFD